MTLKEDSMKKSVRKEEMKYDIVVIEFQ